MQRALCFIALARGAAGCARLSSSLYTVHRANSQLCCTLEEQHAARSFGCLILPCNNRAVFNILLLISDTKVSKHQAAAQASVLSRQIGEHALPTNRCTALTCGAAAHPPPASPATALRLRESCPHSALFVSVCGAGSLDARFSSRGFASPNGLGLPLPPLAARLAPSAPAALRGASLSLGRLGSFSCSASRSGRPAGMRLRRSSRSRSRSSRLLPCRRSPPRSSRPRSSEQSNGSTARL